MMDEMEKAQALLERGVDTSCGVLLKADPELLHVSRWFSSSQSTSADDICAQPRDAISYNNPRLKWRNIFLNSPAKLSSGLQTWLSNSNSIERKQRVIFDWWRDNYSSLSRLCRQISHDVSRLLTNPHMSSPSTDQSIPAPGIDRLRLRHRRPTEAPPTFEAWEIDPMFVRVIFVRKLSDHLGAALNTEETECDFIIIFVLWSLDRLTSSSDLNFKSVCRRKK